MDLIFELRHPIELAFFFWKKNHNGNEIVWDLVGSEEAAGIRGFENCLSPAVVECMNSTGDTSETGRRPVSASKPPPPLGRSMIGRYEVIYPIAQGGMASIYAGRLSGLAGFERIVAIKVIHSHLAAEDSFVRMFLDEARLAARIHHPNVGEIVEVGEDDGIFYMIGELIFGQSLRALMRRSRKKGIKIPNALLADITAQVCRGLHAAHELKDTDGNPLGLVHRDVSPRNILITYDGFVKLIDFGVAFSQGKVSQTDVGTLKGKIGYMSPEQIRCEGLDRRSDIFSLGVVLYQMVTGQQPFSGDSDIERLNKILNYKFKKPTEIVQGLDLELERIILASMAESADNRYANAADMAQDLAKYIKWEAENVGAGVLSNLMHELFSDEYSSHQDQLREYRKDDKELAEDFPKFESKKIKLDTSPGMTVPDETRAATPLSKHKYQREKLSKRMGIIILAAVVVLFLGGIPLFLYFKNNAEPRPGANQAVDPEIKPVSQTEEQENQAAENEPPAAEETSKGIRIDLNINPKTAAVSLDGNALGSGISHISLTADGKNHTIEISREGYATQKTDFIADVDKTIIVTLVQETKKTGRHKKKKKQRNDPFSLKKSPYRND
jgi:serine/threonine protein kinase